VVAGFEWLKTNLPEVLENIKDDLEWQICKSHDYTKIQPDEYAAYDAYFYGGNRSSYVVNNFNMAWLLHIHRNPHHWQYWILINDEPEEDAIIMDIPDKYVIEMICDWWSFSWKTGNLSEIFKWYEERRRYFQFSVKSRMKIEKILFQMEEKLKEMEDEKKHDAPEM
jgi:hypothetical protein